MSRFIDKAATDEITLANGDKVWVRQRLTAEEQAMLRGNLFKLAASMKSGDIEVTEVTWHLQTIRLCETYLTNWNFKDDLGQPVPFDINLIRDLDDVSEMAMAIDALQKKRQEVSTKNG